MSDSYKYLRHAQIVLIGLVLLCAGRPLFADTTWVSGAMHGMFAPQGSPYMIADSAWVNAADTLQVTGGTEVVLPGPHSLLRINGVFKAVGQFSDSVFITLAHTSSSIRGPLTGRARRVEFKYTNLAGIGRVDISADSIIMQSASLQISIYSVAFRAVGIVLQNSNIYRLYTELAVVRIDNSRIINDLTVGYGGLWADSIIVYGRIKGSIPGEGWHVTNSVVEQMRVEQYGGVTQVADIHRSWIGNLEIHDCISTTLSECRVDTSRLEDCGGVVSYCTFDRVTLDYSSPSIYPALLMRNNTFVDHVSCQELEPQAFINHYNFFSDRRQVTLTNNIFYSRRSEITILKPIVSWNYEILQSPPTYNIVCGMSDPWGGRSLGVGNQNIDPLFDPNSEWHDLQPTSPAINHGNPAYTDPDGTVSDIGARWWDHRYDHPPIITTPRWIDVRWGDTLTLKATACDDHQIISVSSFQIPGWFRTARTLDSDEDFLFSGRVPFGARSADIPVTAMDNAGQTDYDIIHLEVHPRSDLPDTISGTLTSEYSPYTFDRDVVIMTGDSLTIEPGVHIRSTYSVGYPSIIVRGLLHIRGTDIDSVWFESDPGTYWWGMLVTDSTASLYASFCNWGNTASLPLHLDRCGLSTIEHCKIGTFTGSLYAIRVENLMDSLQIISSELTGVSVFINADFTVESTDFFPSDTDPTLLIQNCHGTIYGCRFTGYITAHTGSDLQVERCLFQTEGEQYSAANFSSGNPLIGRIRFYHNILMGHSEILLGFPLGSEIDTLYADIANNLFIGADSFAIKLYPNLSRLGIHLSNNCFWSNRAVLCDPRGLLPGLGQPISVNLNDDSTDIYNNIFLDPLFTDTLLWHLAAGSPCIDAGADLGEPFVGLAPDIGWWEWTPTVPFEFKQPVLTSISPFTIFPNPTNGSFVITLPPSDIPRSIEIFNILGQALLRQSVPSGDSRLMSLELPSSFSSGQYFILVNGAFSPMIKPLVIIK